MCSITEGLSPILYWLALRVGCGGPWLDSLRLPWDCWPHGRRTLGGYSGDGLGTASLWGAFPRALNNRLRTGADKDFGTGLLERVGTGIVGTIGYVVLPTGVSTDVSRDIVWRPDKGMTTTTFQLVTETIWSWELSPNPGCSHTNWDSNSYSAQHVESD